MRNIKLRAWDGKKMHPVMALNDDGTVRVRRGTTATGLIHTPTVMQFTGLTDRNGREIYEGDILGSPTRATSHLVVSYGGQSAAFYVSGYNYAGHKRFHRILNKTMLENREVIGNRYEHPELMVS